jgi:hypothetical protein
MKKTLGCIVLDGGRITTLRAKETQHSRHL